MVNLQLRYLEQGYRLRIFLFLSISLFACLCIHSFQSILPPPPPSLFHSLLLLHSFPSSSLSKFEPMCKTIDSIDGGLVLTSFLSPRFIVNRGRFRGETPLPFPRNRIRRGNFDGRS